uniref:Protein phosphatase n=1 Tax=Eutreptiella gymnastica TaxID=73025 RepID=A0A7S4GLE4_9EUGL
MENSYGVLDTITATAAWIWQPIAGKRPPPDLPPPKDSDLVWEAYATCRRDPTKRGRTQPQGWRGDEMDCGEDSFMLTERVLGVADGVGSWRKKGVDPSIFANRLMENAKSYVDTDRDFDPLSVMQKAYSQICKKKEVKAGSSTAVIASMVNNDGLMKVANLGDSGLMVVRDQKCHFLMEEKQWQFNTPYQLTAPPPNWGSSPYGDQPEQSAVSSVQLQEGDLVVLGSDGLFDNLFPNEIAEIVSHANQKHTSLFTQWMRPALSVKATSELLKERVFVASQDRYRNTPFSQDAEKHGLRYGGGKSDDITVIVAKIMRRSELQIGRS